MTILLRVIAVLFVAIAAFLVYAVVNALTSDGGARAGVAVAYIVGAILLSAAARVMWMRAITVRPEA